ncbi:hypothetical protein SDC9_86046 [bioreactor metagenome]|uniref:Uncharacterized protein n=1 Tax=bioreactor metagenome TaxID=1076179 RepID=A0A644ZL51_9ZZZZ
MSKTLEGDVDSLVDVNEFVDTLVSNLEIAGIEEKNCGVVSKFITGSIKQKNKMLLIGKFSTNVADAISATICGRTADIISVINQNVDIEEVIRQINISNSKVILIENVVSLNEAVTLQLFKQNFDKLIIFANEISETVNFIPNSLLNHCNLLCLDNICEKVKEEEFICTDSSDVKFDNQYNKFTYRAAKDELEKLKGKCIYSNSHSATKSELIAIIDDLEENEGFYSWLLCEGIPNLLLTNNNEIAEEIIDTLQLSEKHTNNLKGMIW